jgi:hypothetical protein
MMTRLTALVSLVVFAVAGSAVAAPNFADALVSDGEYAITIIDTGDPAYHEYLGTGLDANAIAFDADATNFYVGLQTATGTSYDIDGSPLPWGMPAGQTNLLIYLFGEYDGGTYSDLLHMIDFESTIGGTSVSVDGILATDAEVYVGNDLEARIGACDLPSLMSVDDFYAYVRLDGNGGWADDEILSSQPVPEPTSLAMLAAGAGLLIRRRRRR